MTLRARHIELPRLALTSALALFFVVGVFPLPLFLPHGAALADYARFWGGAIPATLVPVLLIAAIPVPAIRALPGDFARWLLAPSPRVFAVSVFVAFGAISAFFAYYAFHFSPTTADEIAQLWHARILAHGRLMLPPDPNPEFFSVDNVIDRGAWLSQFPIGGPIVLAVGYVVRLPWLINPLLGALTAAALYHFARVAFGELQGRAIAALFVFTPMALLMSASYMNHVPVLFLAVVALAALVEWERANSRKRSALWAAAIGGALGVMATIRPLDAVVVSLSIGLFQLSVLRRAPRRWGDLAVQAGVGALAVVPLFYANWATTGGAFHFAYEALWGAGHRLGFHVDPQGAVNTPMRAAIRAAKYVGELNSMAVGWPIPALLVAIVALASMRRTTRWDALVLGLFVAQLAAYAIYWHDGEFLGPRFLYTALPTIVILLARAPFLVAERWGDSWNGYWCHAAPMVAVACVVLAWLVPASPVGAWRRVSEVHGARQNFKADLAAAAETAGAHHALVFVHEPFGGRLIRRVWELGMPRSAAAQLFERADACSLLEAVRGVEGDASLAPDARAAAVAARAVPFVAGPAQIHALDPSIHITSDRSLTLACRDALEADAKFGGLPFGSALLLDAIEPNGRVGGDVVYVADLDDHNEALRARFGDRTWYRAMYVDRDSAGAGRAVVKPY